MRFCWAGLLFVVAAFGWAKAPQVVSRAEAAVVFSRMAGLVRTCCKVSGTVAFERVTQPTKPVTKQEVVHAFYLLFQKARPGFKLVPALTKVDSRTAVGWPSTAMAEARSLSQWGFLAPVGPLVVGTKPEVTVPEFGEAIGLFLSRLADLTHQSSRKYSPNLMIDPAPRKIPNVSPKKKVKL